MSDVKVEVVTFKLSTAAAGNVQNVSIPGFGMPKAAIFMVQNTGVLNLATSTQLRGSIGWYDGTDQGAVGYASAHAAATSNTARSQSNTAVIIPPRSDAASNNTEFKAIQFFTDGVTLQIVTADTTGKQCTLILIGGDDVTGAKVGELATGTGISPLDINTIGFEPSLVWISSTSSNIGFDTVRTHQVFNLGIGINDGADTQKFLSVTDFDNKTVTECNSLVTDGKIIGGASLGGGTTWGMVAGDYDSAGFSLVPDGNQANLSIYYLALQFSADTDVALFDMEWPISGDYIETSPGFTPTFGFVATVQGPVTRGTANASNCQGTSFSWFDSNGIITNNYSSKDNLATSYAYNSIWDSLRILSYADTTIDRVIADDPVFTSQGFDFAITTNPVTLPVLGFGLAIGPGTAAVTVVASGAVQAQPATTTGIVNAFFTAEVSGVVLAQPASVTGTINVSGNITVNGAVQAQDASVAGSITAQTFVSVSGIVSAQLANVSGSVNVEGNVTLSGTVQAQAATVSGNIDVETIVETSGVVAAQDATIAGNVNATTYVATSGIVQAQSSSVLGTINVSRNVSVSGVVQAQDANVAGNIIAFSYVTTSGNVQAQDASVNGSISAFSAISTVEMWVKVAPNTWIPINLADTIAPVIEVTSSYNIAGVGATVLCNNTTPITITLPTLVNGGKVSVIRANTGGVTIDGNGENIIGEATQILPSRYDTSRLIGSALGWFLI